jgi:hypothetical protein
LQNWRKLVTTTTITDALLARYRSRFDLSARAWQSEHVRGYVLALSTRITIALVAGHESTAHDIATMLASLEPLEAIREHEYGGHVLWIGYNWHAVRDRETTRVAIEVALRKWPGDARLVRMREVVTMARA